MFWLEKRFIPLRAKTHSRGAPRPALPEGARNVRHQVAAVGKGAPLPQEAEAHCQREQPCQGERCHGAQQERQQHGRGAQPHPGPRSHVVIRLQKIGPNARARASDSPPTSNGRCVSSTGEQRGGHRRVGVGEPSASTSQRREFQARVLGQLLASPRVSSFAKTSRPSDSNGRREIRRRADPYYEPGPD